MQAEQVTNKILSDARAEAATIREQAAQREAAEDAKLDEELTRFEQETEAMAGKAAEEERAQRLAIARMEAARQRLAGKAALLDDIFAEARRRIDNLPDNEYRELMARLMLAAVDTGDEQVIVGRNDSRIDQTLIDAVNGKLKDRGKGNLALCADKHDLAGGFLLKRGKVRTNVTIGVLLRQVRNDLTIELARDLFGQGQAGR